MRPETAKDARPPERSVPNTTRPAEARSNGLIDLQKHVGNRAVVSVIQAQALRVGSANDPAEHEADEVARQVLAHVRGLDVEAKSDDEPLSVRRRGVDGAAPAGVNHGPEGGLVDPEVSAQIERARAGGSSLSPEIRGPLESAFGADFSSVQLHTGDHAEQLNRSLNAAAFTTGTDVFFGKGAYQPGTAAGDELLAHELTHVVQQSGAAERKVHRSLVRDRVFSDVEFVQNTEAPREGGGEDRTWTTLLAQLKELEKKHNSLNTATTKLASPDSFEQRFAGRQRNLKTVVKAGEDIVNGIPYVITQAEGFVASEEAKTSGVGNKVKGIFKGKADKRRKATRLDQVRTLLIQLERRRDQLRVETEKHRFDLVNMKKQEINAQGEGPEQKQAAMDEARHGTFGMYKGRVNDAKFGEGAMGSVAQVDYKDEKGDLFKGVFKAEPDRLGDNDGGMSGLGTNAESPNLSLRAVAASRLNELLGMKVIPRTELAFHEQFGFGQVMALAGGKSPKTKTKIEIKDADPQKIAAIEQVLQNEEKQFGPQSKLVKKQAINGQVTHFLEESITFETDWDHPILKRELANLQLLDGLIGNIDRHCENYFIQVDAFGNPIGVLGIDNDLTFARDHNDPTEVAFFQGHHAGMPPAVDRYVAEKFCAVTEAQVRSAVKGLLTGVEIGSLVVRLKTIQDRLNATGPKGFLIPRIGSDQEGAKEWTELKDPEKVKGAYFARERHWQQGDMKQMGRLVKPQQALLYKEDRLDSLMKEVKARQG
jgi:Domain of unknown function (DUF4157)